MPPRSMRRPAVVAAFAAAATATRADQQPITIDGAMDDWTDVPIAYTDAVGDGGAIDLRRLWIADDDRFLFLRLQVGAELDLAENNDLRLYLDTDLDAGTGLAINGIGAELEWRLGDRDGFFRHDGSTTSIFHDDIRFRGLPTVTATVFEMAIGRDTLPDGANALFDGAGVRVALRDVGGDWLPALGETLTYTLDVGGLPPESPLDLGRDDPGDVRVATFNVLNDSPWDPGQEPRFGRLLAATDADVLNFQEIHDHSATETRNLVAAWLPGPWFAASNADCKTVSRFPILGSWGIDNNLAVLLDTTAALGAPALVINAHLPCCTNDAGRQDEVDAIAAFIRDARDGTGPVTIGPDTPLYVVGDLNLVGFAQQLETLLEGDIVDEGTHGPDAAPDGDGTSLESVPLRQTEKRMGYTWRNDNSSFWPGQLDFIIHADSVVPVKNRFALYTPEMSPASLAAAGLLATDSLASDHLLVVADFGPIDGVPGDVDGDGDVDIDDVVQVILEWGPCPGGGAPCPADVDRNLVVDVDDVVLVILNWTG